MIISSTHRFAFLCTPKCASTAIEHALRPHGQLILSGPPRFKHINFRDFEQYVLPLVHNRFPDLVLETICVMREPLEWANSWYRYRGRVDLADPAHAMHRNYTGHLTFDQFIEAVLSQNPPSFARIGSQYRFMQAPDGSIGIDRIFDYRRLQRLVDHLSNKLRKPLKLTAANVSPPGEVRLEPGLRARFQEAYAADFALYARLS